MNPRYFDWPARLEAEVARRAAMAFRWGRHDCVLAAVACVEAMTGQDLAADLPYATKAEAEALIAQARSASSTPGAGGFEALIEAAAARHGMEAVTWRTAQRGDLALVDTPQGPSLGVVWLDGTSVKKAVRIGWQAVPLKQALRAWRVG